MHLDFFAVGAVEQGVHRLGAHLLDGRIQRKAVFFTKTKIIHLAHRALGVVPAAGLDGTLPDGKAAVGQNAVLVHPHKGAKTGAFFAGTQRVIEGKEPGRQVADGDAVLRAGKVLAEGHALAADDVHLGYAASERQRRFQRIRQTAADALAQGKAVHHDLHRMLDVLFQRLLNGSHHLLNIGVAHIDANHDTSFGGIAVDLQRAIVQFDGRHLAHRDLESLRRAHKQLVQVQVFHLLLIQT